MGGMNGVQPIGRPSMNADLHEAKSSLYCPAQVLGRRRKVEARGRGKKMWIERGKEYVNIKRGDKEEENIE